MPGPGESGEGGLQRLKGIPLEDREPEAMQGGGPRPSLERPQATRQVDAGGRPSRALDERDRRGAQDHEIEAASVVSGGAPTSTSVSSIRITSALRSW